MSYSPPRGRRVPHHPTTIGPLRESWPEYHTRLPRPAQTMIGGPRPAQTMIGGAIRNFSPPRRYRVGVTCGPRCVTSVVHNQQMTTQHLSDRTLTCYAHAVATVIRAAQSRIVGRHRNNFDDLVCEITSEFGYEGGDVFRVLETICPRKRLQCVGRDPREVSHILEGRPLVACFSLTESQWCKFTDFFKRCPRGTLSSDDLGPDYGDRLDGHAVAIIGFGQEREVDCNGWEREVEYFKMKNSWGRDFADDGYFRVEKNAFEYAGLEFVDVFYTLDDISETEHAAYESYVSEFMSGKSPFRI